MFPGRSQPAPRRGIAAWPQVASDLRIRLAHGRVRVVGHSTSTSRRSIMWKSRASDWPSLRPRSDPLALAGTHVRRKGQSLPGGHVHRRSRHRRRRLPIPELRRRHRGPGRGDWPRKCARRADSLLVFGRLVDGKFLTLGDLNLPPALAEICSEMGEDISARSVSSSCTARTPKRPGLNAAAPPGLAGFFRPNCRLKNMGAKSYGCAEPRVTIGQPKNIDLSYSVPVDSPAGPCSSHGSLAT